MLLISQTIWVDACLSQHVVQFAYRRPLSAAARTRAMLRSRKSSSSSSSRCSRSIVSTVTTAATALLFRIRTCGRPLSASATSFDTPRCWPH